MKKIFCFLGLISLLWLNESVAQSKVAEKVKLLSAGKTRFIPYPNLLEKDNPKVAFTTTDSLLKKSTFVYTTPEKIHQMYQAANEYIEFDIPYQNTVYTVQLYRSEPFAKNFELITPSQRNVFFKKGLHYRGMVKNDPHSLVSISFYENKMAGIISLSNQKGNLVLGKPVGNYPAELYIVYNDILLQPFNLFKCKADTQKIMSKKNNQTNRSSSAVPAQKCVGLYLEADYDLFLANNSSVTETTNWVETLFNSVQTLFENDEIHVELSSLYIWTTQDPYSAFTDINDIYINFVYNRDLFSGDLAQLISIDPGELIGGSYGAPCNETLKHGYSNLKYDYDAFPFYSFNVYSITHEFGHLLGSPHTHDCFWNGNDTPIDGCVEAEGCITGPIPAEGGTLMSHCHLNPVGINLANGFGPQPKQAIINTLNESACLSTDCTSYCFRNINNESLTIGTATDTSITADWTLLNPMDTELSYKTVNSSTYTIVSTAATAPYQISGLQPNTHYTVKIKNTCPGNATMSWEVEKTTATSGDFCSGIELTDSGGVSGNYQNNELTTRVIIPENADEKAKITFTAFDLESGYDYLYIYNGNNTGAQELTGGLTGNTIPAAFESTAPDGSLTMSFISDFTETKAGYAATVECNVLNNPEFPGYIDFSYYPNPTKDKIHFKANQTIKSFEVYDINGKLIEKKVNTSMEGDVDLSKFSTGNYEVKLQFENKTSVVKIIKK